MACQVKPGRPRRSHRILLLATALIAVIAAPTAFGMAHVSPSGVQADAVITFARGHLTLSPMNLQSGTNVLFVQNRDTHAHELEITGPGGQAKHTRVLGAGATATLTILLRAGSYAVVDTMAARKTQQKQQLVVAAAPAVVPGHVPLVQPPPTDVSCI